MIPKALIGLGAMAITLDGGSLTVLVSVGGFFLAFGTWLNNRAGTRRGDAREDARELRAWKNYADELRKQVRTLEAEPLPYPDNLVED